MCLVCVCLCVCVCMSVHISVVHKHVEVRINVEYLKCSQCYLLRQGLLLNFEVGNSSNLANQPAFVTPCLHPPNDRNTRG